MQVYIVTYKTEQQDTRVGAVYDNLADAKVECERLANANPWCAHAIPVIREVDVDRRIQEAIDYKTVDFGSYDGTRESVVPPELRRD